jgi:hypothetical protein
MAMLTAYAMAAVASAGAEWFHSVPGPNVIGPCLWIINPLALLWVTFDLVQPGNGFENHGGPTILRIQPVVTILALCWLARRYRNLGKVRP